MPKPPRERFQDILETFTVGMLVTEGPDKVLTARPMNVAAIDSDADIWFCTQVDTPKTDDIQSHPDVLVAFQDSGRYLTLNGPAEINRSRSKINELWNESWKVWFPDGPDDPKLALLHVKATHGQYWDNSWLQGLSYAIRAGQAYWRGEEPEIPEDVNAKVELP
ncbi:pyridoxamine 5'-phosphate oxidase family protein [Botrimarina mediterranea]|uniref:General stress protein 26 n=1 Tax=Botrimarina mediterranea TaxID=2528022 RepID=A0A518KDE6_9BACT|nr:pyridoxamine 5'-phosphate oxidase family protein [Botrimarina mediterranea]QDV75824.1 General stress protein 26 [Botrimarina mediterranea]QDV80421.1 General stress protein 26 [Planctomycetes bacterium K2D]